MTKKTACLASLLIVLTLVIAALSLEYYGMGRRSQRRPYGVMEKAAPVSVVRTSTGVYSQWKAQGFSGRVVVHVGRYFSFVSQQRVIEKIPDLKVVPANAAELLQEYETKLSHKDYLWVAMQAGLTRHIFTVLPPEVYRERSSRGKSEETADGIELASMGLRRTISDKIPPLREPVLLVIDASYFTTPEAGPTLQRQLAASGLKTDLVTLCLSNDSPDVTAEQKARLLEFAQKLTPWTVPSAQ